MSKRLGHASSAITSDLYSHLLDDIDRQTAEAVEIVLGARPTDLHTRRTHIPGFEANEHDEPQEN